MTGPGLTPTAHLIHGYLGVGKTRFARKLSEQTGAICLSAAGAQRRVRIVVTRDGRFKREARRVARKSGQPYTSVRARLDEARGHPRATDDDEPIWTVAYTFAGVEDGLADWLLSNNGADLGRVLVGVTLRKVAPTDK